MWHVFWLVEEWWWKNNWLSDLTDWIGSVCWLRKMKCLLPFFLLFSLHLSTSSLPPSLIHLFPFLPSFISCISLSIRPSLSPPFLDWSAHWLTNEDDDDEVTELTLWLTDWLVRWLKAVQMTHDWWWLACLMVTRMTGGDSWLVVTRVTDGDSHDWWWFMTDGGSRDWWWLNILY